MMEALKKKPDLSVRRSMNLPDGTRIDVIGMTVRKTMELANNKKLTPTELGMHAIAAKMLVDGSPVVIDDLLDCFSDDEFKAISEFVTGEEKEDPEKNEESPTAI